MPYVRITVYIPEEFKNWLQKEATKQKRSISNFVYLILDNYRQKNGEKVKEA